MTTEKQTTENKDKWKEVVKEIGVTLSIAFIQGVFATLGARTLEHFTSNKNGKVVPLHKVG